MQTWKSVMNNKPTLANADKKECNKQNAYISNEDKKECNEQ